MQEVRCEKCNKLLYITYPDQFAFRDIAERVDVNIDHFIKANRRIECKCPKCGHMNISKEGDY